MDPRKDHTPPAAFFYILFTLSGFSGLIYESIWTHYLKLFLGHAAYAQTLVLAIFMGGMAIGSWLCSRYTRRWNNLLLGYAFAEAVIGICALFFHPVFDSFVSSAYTRIIPGISSPEMVSLFKWTTSSLLILPQSILLGMTFPLMSAGIMRLFPDRPGRTISLLYFTNSIGASVGALVSGFILIRIAGLPGTIQTAGFINLALAATVWMLARNRPAEPPAVAAAGPLHGGMTGTFWFYLLLATSLITGAASFIYEIGWIRMLVLVLGSSTHAFELMLSAFILGLALGGLYIHRRIDAIGNPLRFLVFVQVIMGALALSTLPLYGNTFPVMQWLVETLPKTDTGYFFFNIASHGIAIVLMLPATFCAGMTLPLITYTLLRRGYGEKSIGAVYAYNTVGAIAGVFFAIHIGMPLLGLKGLMIAGAGLDIALGFTLLLASAGAFSRRLTLAIAAGCVAVLGSVIAFVHPDPYKMASGVYRTGLLMSSEVNDLVFHKDGKTATVSVAVYKDSFVTSIRTNGKSDAGIVMKSGRGITPDEATMVLSGFLPMAHFPQAATAANIGLGSGLTTQVLLSNPRLTRVDTVEIEKFMVEGAKHFRPRTERVYTDPRSHIYIDDAKTFFSVHNKKYDIIISEPSNPWVSGVASLFSEEFYRIIRGHLTEKGIFVQWLQLYEIDPSLVVSVLKAVSSHFPDFMVYTTNHFDIVLVAKNNGRLDHPTPELFSYPLIREELGIISVRNIQDIEIRRIGDKQMLEPFLRDFPIRPNSDYYPVLDLNASRTRFLETDALDMVKWVYEPLPFFDMLSSVTTDRERTEVSKEPIFSKTKLYRTAMGLRDFLLQGISPEDGGEVPPEALQAARELLKQGRDCGSSGADERLHLLFETLTRITPYLTRDESSAVMNRIEEGYCRDLSPEEKGWMELFRAAGRRDGDAMSEHAESLLATDSRTSRDYAHFLTAAAMLGNLGEGKRQEADRIWRTYQNRISEKQRGEIAFLVLTAHARSR